MQHLDDVICQVTRTWAGVLNIEPASQRALFRRHGRAEQASGMHCGLFGPSFELLQSREPSCWGCQAFQLDRTATVTSFLLIAVIQVVMTDLGSPVGQPYLSRHSPHAHCVNVQNTACFKAHGLTPHSYASPSQPPALESSSQQTVVLPASPPARWRCFLPSPFSFASRMNARFGCDWTPLC